MAPTTTQSNHDPAKETFSIITSGRYDPRLAASSSGDGGGSAIYLGAYHLDRLRASAHALHFHHAAHFLASHFPRAEDLQRFIQGHFRKEDGVVRTLLDQDQDLDRDQDLDQAFKFRILLSSHHPSPSTLPSPEDSKPQSSSDPHSSLLPSPSSSPLSISSSPVPSLPLSSFYPTTLSTPLAMPTELHRWRLFLLPYPVTLSVHPAAAHKTTARTVYDAARAELADRFGYADLPPDIEVLLPVVSSFSSLSGADPSQTSASADTGTHGAAAAAEEEDTEISEATRSTPYFFRAHTSTSTSTSTKTWVTPRAAAGGCRGTARRWALDRGLAQEARIATASLTIGERVWVSNAVRGFGWGVLEAWPGDK